MLLGLDLITYEPKAQTLDKFGTQTEKSAGLCKHVMSTLAEVGGSWRKSVLGLQKIHLHNTTRLSNNNI